MPDIFKLIKNWRDDEKSNPNLFSLVVFVFLVGSISVFVWLAPIFNFDIPAIDPVSYNTYKCNGKGPSSKTFSIYALHYHSAKQLSDLLCEDPRVSKRVGQVEAQWRHQNITDLEILQNNKYDLLIAHSSYIERAEVQDITGYKILASYEPYMSYLIALKGEKIALSSKYFTGKRIGLRDNPLSQSGHILPLQALREAGIEKELFEIKYFKEHSQLREALIAGEVDIIGSYWTENENKRYGDLQRFELKSAKPSNWYYLPAHKDVICAVSDALSKLKEGSENSYYRSLSIQPICSKGNT